ncbi:MAG: 30S ribosome-binding factor RbfA [Phycisphaerae bacterium]|nr:30S ribosome-binding factor RbfA [Phycisphaerae bacterium]
MSVRQRKIESQIRRVASMVMLRDLEDPRITGIVSVTKVEITPDLREAKIYVSILSSSPEATVFQGLVHAQAFVQREVAKALSMRVVPHLSFVLDHSLKKQAEIDRLLAESKGIADD